ncbi:hypothetical protein [Caballeronia sp. GAFFF2]|uniref:hypothetical protein n=1 Tax=Caballeronia sp. GAFFF2 TaxID=2921741 RepID=UPI00202862E5|nr:hypothetical protein [Caballeronia sp. GAFFF2]
MKPNDPFPTGSYELRLTDADLAHLRIVIPDEVRDRNRVLPLAYWRRRVMQILETRHLVPAQLAVASALLAQIDSAVEAETPLAKAS